MLSQMLLLLLLSLLATRRDDEMVFGDARALARHLFDIVSVEQIHHRAHTVDVAVTICDGGERLQFTVCSHSQIVCDDPATAEYHRPAHHIGSASFEALLLLCSTEVEYLCRFALSELVQIATSTFNWHHV